LNPAGPKEKPKKIFDPMQTSTGTVPASLQLASASPWMLKTVWQSIQFAQEVLNKGCPARNSRWKILETPPQR
jgi:hypothetical protein